jgi:hypothetical protein
MAQTESDNPIASISALLTPGEIEKLSQALVTVTNHGNGWGQLEIRFKGGRIDTIEMTSSILVRDKGC